MVKVRINPNAFGNALGSSLAEANSDWRRESATNAPKEFGLKAIDLRLNNPDGTPWGFNALDAMQSVPLGFNEQSIASDVGVGVGTSLIASIGGGGRTGRSFGSMSQNPVSFSDALFEWKRVNVQDEPGTTGKTLTYEERQAANEIYRETRGDSDLVTSLPSGREQTHDILAQKFPQSWDWAASQIGPDLPRGEVIDAMAELYNVKGARGVSYTDQEARIARLRGETVIAGGNGGFHYKPSANPAVYDKVVELWNVSRLDNQALVAEYTGLNRITNEDIQNNVLIGIPGGWGTSRGAPVSRSDSASVRRDFSFNGVGPTRLSAQAKKLYSQSKYREALDVHYEDLVRTKTGGTSQVINGREIDVVTDKSLIQVKRVTTALDKPENFLNKATRTQIKMTIEMANEQGKNAEFWFKYGVSPKVRSYIEAKGGIVKTGLGD